MPRTCIICGKRAGSHEHIFPAALGGRRTNKKIYCGPHNNDFAPLAEIVARQLRSINALLAVRPDHKDSAEPFVYVSPEGDELIIFDGTVRRARPAAPDSGQRLHVQLELGGLNGLRAIAYIALTFFAHHFRSYARDSGLDLLKAFVLGNAENVFVWWDKPPEAGLLPPNPFPFGHTIVLMTSAGSHEAAALVSLFQTLHFGVHLGTVDGLTDKSVVVFIDPHADKPPDDIKEHKCDSVFLPVVRPEPIQAYLEANIRERVAERAFQELLNKIERWKFEKDMAHSLARLNAARRLPVKGLIDESRAVVEEQTSRVYRLMRYVGSEFIENQHNPVLQPVLEHVKAVIERDAADPSRLTPAAENCAMKCMLALIEDLSGLSQWTISGTCSVQDTGLE
jgi:hypothetical protein